MNFIYRALTLKALLLYYWNAAFCYSAAVVLQNIASHVAMGTVKRLYDLYV